MKKSFLSLLAVTMLIGGGLTSCGPDVPPDDPTPGENEGGNENTGGNEGGNENTGGNEGGNENTGGNENEGGNETPVTPTVQTFKISVEDKTGLDTEISNFNNVLKSSSLTVSNVSGTKVFGTGGNGIRLASSKAGGEFSFSFNPSIIIEKIIFTGKGYNDNSITSTITTSAGGSKVLSMSTQNNYDVVFNDTKPSTNIKITTQSKQRPIIQDIYLVGICSDSSLGGDEVGSGSGNNNSGNTGELINPDKPTFTDAQITAYYSSIDFSLTGDNLRRSLNTKIKNHNDIGYDGLWTAYKTTDNDGAGKIFCMYTGLSFFYGKGNGGQQDGGSGGTAEGQYYNREHTTPQSWFGKSGPERSDLFNVYPTDKYINGKRGDMDYGEVGTATIESSNGCKVGVSRRSDNANTVFEIADEFKGDIARSYFYMATRYMYSTSWGGCSSKVYKTTSSSVTLSQHGIDLLMKWAANDPVSQREIDRNNAVYALQNNRNPFIDYPDLASKIWTPSSNYLSM